MLSKSREVDAMSGRPPKPSSATSGLQEACVRELVGNYTGMEILHPIVADMSKDRKFKGMFWKVLSHEYEVISKRSQDLAQWEITAAQKAFKILMEGGNENGAVELYCDEILGLRCKLGAEWSQMMASILQTRDHIMGSKLKPPYGFFGPGLKLVNHRVLWYPVSSEVRERQVRLHLKPEHFRSTPPT